MWWAWTGTGWGADLPVGVSRLYGSVDAALVDALPGDRIVVDPGVYDEDTDLLDVVDIEIVGAGSDPATGTVFGGGDGTSQWLIRASSVVLRDLVIDGGTTRRSLTIEGGSSVEAFNVRIQNGGQPAGGGIAVNGSTLNLYDAFVVDNQSAGSGAGLYAAAGSVVHVERSRFVTNRASADGGGIWVGAATLTLRASSVADNTGQNGGGLMCSAAASCGVEDTTFERNTAIDGGGALYAFNVADLGVLRTSFCGNLAGAASGGAVTLFANASVAVRNSTFLDDDATDYGGALLVRDTTLTLENNTFARNHAGARGGAVYQDGVSSTRSTNNLYVESLADDAPQAAVDVVSGAATWTGGWDLYFANTDDLFTSPAVADPPNVDPELTFSGACEAPEAGAATTDAGDPEILDPDGTRSDVGATGGPAVLRDRDGDGTFDGEDCNDADPEQRPGALELCNEVDDNCNGAIDEGCPPDLPLTDPRSGEPVEAEAVGCTCTSGPTPASIGWVLLTLAAGLRRRRADRPPGAG